jgi:hypothetical protein
MSLLFAMPAAPQSTQQRMVWKAGYLYCSSQKGKHPIVSRFSISSDTKYRSLSEGIQAGGIFVDKPLEAYIREKLTQVNVPEEVIDLHVTRGMEVFEISLKPNFVADGASCKLVIGDTYTNMLIGVRLGKMTLSRYIPYLFPTDLLGAC